MLCTEQKIVIIVKTLYIAESQNTELQCTLQASIWGEKFRKTALTLKQSCIACMSYAFI